MKRILNNYFFTIGRMGDQAHNAVVGRLETLALEAVYREVVCNLLLCPEHVSLKAEKEYSFSNAIESSSLISLNPLFKSKKLIKSIRKRLDFHLIGTMSDRVRVILIGKHLDEFEKISRQRRVYSLMKNVEGYDCKPQTTELPDIWAFFDSVLNEKNH